MIQGFSDYEKTETNNFGERERIKLGGHICKILGVETESVVSKKDGLTYNILKLKFDMEEPDEQAGFYGRRFAEDAKKDALNAKWKGYHKVTIPTNNSVDFIKTTWKTFLTSIEKSNPGVAIDGNKGFDENILIGKTFGGIFALEEFQLPNDGKVIAFPRIRWVRSTEKINEAPIPKVKLLDGTYTDYEEYVNNKKQGSNETKPTNTTTEVGTIGENDDLPF